MQLQVTNQGEKTVRVIVDGDTINDLELKPAESIAIDSKDEGTIEFRELGA